MSPYREMAKIELIYRGLGIGLAIEMILRGVLTLLATLNRTSVFQVAATWSLPFTLAGGAAILICHLAHAEKPWRYRLGQIGHAVGLVWAFVFGGAILISWLTGTTPTALAAPVFFLIAGIHLAFQIVSGREAKWTRRQSS